MIRYSSEVSIARSPHDVFGALLDPKKYEQWTEMTDVQFEGGAPKVGTRGSFRIAKGPIKGVLEMEITEMEPDRSSVVRVTHPNPPVAIEDDAGARRGRHGARHLRPSLGGGSFLVGIPLAPL